MLIEFDPAKDAANREKHGVSLGNAALLDWNTAVVWQDMRFDYGEERMCALAYIGLRLYFAAFVDRGQARRIISLRRANEREENHYART